MKNRNKKEVWLWRAGFLLLPAAALLAGCSREDAPGPGPSGDAVELHAGIATRTAAGGNEWLTSDAVGIFMLEAGSDMTQSAPYGLNVKYNPASDGGTALLRPAHSDQQLFWPLAAGRYDFIAYYPWQAVEGNEFTYSVDITDPDAELDILYARKLNKFTGSPIGFEFSHKMARLRINIQAEGMVSDEDIASLSLTLRGVPVKAEMALSTGQVSPIDPVDSDELLLMAHETVTPGYDATFEAIVVPHKYSDYLLPHLVIGIGGTPLYWNFPKVDDVSEGKVKVYNLKVKGQDVSLISSTIDEWENQGDPDEGQLGKLRALPEANSYMIAPGSGEVYIPVSQANKVLLDEYRLDADIGDMERIIPGKFSVELVWGDTPVGENGVIKSMAPFDAGEGYIKLEPGDIPGNAVIAIRDHTDKIRWSWHIWITEPVGQATDNGSGLTWMDRNLGATYSSPYVDGVFDTELWYGTRGLYYQWGRKDAFPGGVNSINAQPGNQQFYTGNSQQPTTDILANNLVELYQLTQNPRVFTNSGSYRGSVNSGSDNPSWSDNGKKTIYDPCPPGWKVPPIKIGDEDSWGANDPDIWGLLENYGRMFRGVEGQMSPQYYPAGGLRLDSNGQLLNHGTRGYYWSATSHSSSAGYNLSFSSGGVTPANGNARAHGFPVRCVAE